MHLILQINNNKHTRAYLFSRFSRNCNKVCLNYSNELFNDEFIKNISKLDSSNNKIFNKIFSTIYIL